jgi:peptidoglycan L-alanyl-D-glutamate endopeptidase CwlK
MSATLLPDEIKFLQRMLCSAGCYAGPRNGVWNQAVDDAEAELKTIADQLVTELGEFDPRSERCIRSLHPKAQRAARAFLTTLRDAGIDARIISGTRTYPEQDALFRRGRFGDTSPRVTNARGGQSNHNFGIAWDLGIFKDGKYLTTAKPYKEAATLRPASVDWGGNWPTFPDFPHYQLAIGGASIADIRTSFEKGSAFVPA